MTTTTNATAAASANNNVYEQFLSAQEELESLEQRENEDKSRKMFEAWQRAEQQQQQQPQNPRSQGVAVVKTLVRETHQHNLSSSSNKKKELQTRVWTLLEQAAMEQGHAKALVQWGNRQLELAKTIVLGGGDSSNDEHQEQERAARELVELAMECFRRSGNAGNRIGWFNLGQLLWTGFPVHENEQEDASMNDASQIVPSDMHQAMEAFTHAIDLGDADAMYLVGVHRMTAGGRENIHSGFALVERAASQGHGGAQYYLSLLHLNGEPHLGLEPCEEQTFMELLDRAVEAGSTDAMFSRGHSYFHGSEGYPRDPRRALQDFLDAAQQGHADAAVSAGAILHSGMGVPKDQRRAFELYQLAGELGSQEGWQNVVACYTTGEGVPQSLETAKYIRDTMLKKDLT